MSNSLKDREELILTQFSKFTQWEDKYKSIIDMGKKLPAFPDEKRNDDNKIKGCQSQVWLWAEMDSEKKLLLFADSDAIITKGLVAMVVYLYNGISPAEVTSHSLELFKKLGLFDHLSPSRANGFANMIKQVKNYALAYQLKG